MQYKVFSIRDAKGELFHQPFFKVTHGEAERDFLAACKDPKTQLNQFPEDFDLYYLGTFDNVKGTFDSLPTPQHVTKAIFANRPVQDLPNLASVQPQ